MGDENNLKLFLFVIPEFREAKYPGSSVNFPGYRGLRRGMTKAGWIPRTSPRYDDVAVETEQCSVPTGIAQKGTLMNVNIVTIGTKMPSWINEGFQEYAKRMPKEIKINLVELPLAKSSSKTSVQQLMEQEGKSILNVLPEKNRVIVLDVNGVQFSTEQLANRLQSWREDGRDISIIIGGPEGLSKAVLSKAEIKWSLSALTFPHSLVRVILAEQLYRAWSYLSGHPYHRG